MILKMQNKSSLSLRFQSKSSEFLIVKDSIFLGFSVKMIEERERESYFISFFFDYDVPGDSDWDWSRRRSWEESRCWCWSRDA